MVTIKTGPANAAGADHAKILISPAGECPVPGVVPVVSGACVTIENRSPDNVFVVVKKNGKQEANEKIKVYVYDLRRLKKSPVYKVKPSDRVFTLKYQIFRREKIEPSHLFLSIDGEGLDDFGSFADQNIRNDDVIVLSMLRN